MYSSHSCSPRWARAERRVGSACRALCRKDVDGAIGTSAQIDSAPSASRCDRRLRRQAIRALLPDHPGGLLLRPAVSVPIEIYTEARIAEFAGDEVAIGRYLPRKRARAPRSKTK